MLVQDAPPRCKQPTCVCTLTKPCSYAGCCLICWMSQVPDQLRQLFEKNYELLLSIFNPEGWLDITYVDSQLRIGRDDKGNLFVLERAQKAAAGSS